MSTETSTSSREQLSRDLEKTISLAYKHMMPELRKAHEHVGWYLVREAGKQFHGTKKKQCTVTLDIDQLLEEFHLFHKVDDHFLSMLADRLSWMWSSRGSFTMHHDGADATLNVKFVRE